jgi:hypothetical protein
MACEKCINEGKIKIIHFARCGRWDTRIYCEHTYTRGKLIANEGSAETYHGGNERKEVRHVLSRHQVAPIKKGSRQKCPDRRLKHDYTAEEDKFILANYSTKSNRYNHKGEGLMKKMLAAFEEEFGWRPTPNQMVGRYNRLRNLKPDHKPLENVAETRAVPSLPVLKFMQRGTDA